MSLASRQLTPTVLVRTGGDGGPFIKLCCASRINFLDGLELARLQNCY